MREFPVTQANGEEGGGQVYKICLPLPWVAGRSEGEVKGEGAGGTTDQSGFYFEPVQWRQEEEEGEGAAGD